MSWLIWLLHVCAVLLLVYMFLAAPNVFKRKYNLRHLTACDYAHRGVYKNGSAAPENSMPAFEKAMKAGYGIELDVRETRDHVLVVHHDETLERACKDQRRVCDVPLHDIKEMPLFGIDERVPTFDEVLALVDGKVPLIVELKTDFNNPALPGMVYERLKNYKGDYCVESFDPFAIRWFKKNAPGVVRGQLSFMPPLKDKSFKEKLRRVALGYLLVNFLSRPDFIAYGYKTDANISYRFISAVFRPLLAAWTVQDADTYRELQQEYDIQIFEHFNAERTLL